MALEEYARKRSFDKTPEPAPKKPAEVAGNRFFIQRHHARRLHYDLRLEIGGTLKSWAVPQGPTLDPAIKRLAVMVEDHPIDYGTFEGNIPKGNYGAGSVMVWDLGTYELLGDKPVDKQLEIGDLKIRFHGQKLSGEFALVRMKGRGKGNEWLLIKKRGPEAAAGWDANDYATSALSGRTQEEIARDLPAQDAKKPRASKIAAGVPNAVKSEMLDDLAPMMAFPVDRPPTGDAWLHEVKWDGVRALCYLDPTGIRLITRNGNRCDAQYPELTAIRNYINAETAVLDGEIAALDDKGRPRFELIQPRIHLTGAHTIANLARTNPVTYFLFDILYLDGYDLRRAPLIERKKALDAVYTPSEMVRVSQHFLGNGAEFLAAARENELEGIVSKRADSAYEHKRSNCWLKTKIVAEQEFVICGYTKGERGGYFGALILGIYDKGKLAWTGNVGTGFDQKLLEKIYNLLQPMVTPRSPFAEAPKGLKDITWVRPELVCQVKFANWTNEGRLRAPVFLGLRTDIDPKQCVRETAGEPPTEEESQGPVKPQVVLPEKGETIVSVDGQRLKFTNLSKVFYPKEGYTKRDLIAYYDGVAELLLPHLKDRPLSLKRYPNGIEGGHFFQKEAAESFPSWLRTEPIQHEHNKEPTNYVLVDNRAGLLYLANLACIDQNPWMSRVGSLDSPDFILIDLDPSDCPYSKIVEAALLVRRKLDLLELEGYPKTTGGDGMHIYIPLEPGYSYAQARSFAEILARLLAAERPDLFTTPRAVARREKGKVYFDYAQIVEGKTISAPYVVRAYAGAPVSTPLAWRELTPKLNPTDFHIRNVLERFARVGDLYQPVLTRLQSLDRAIERLDPLVRG